MCKKQHSKKVLIIAFTLSNISVLGFCEIKQGLECMLQ